MPRARSIARRWATRAAKARAGGGDPRSPRRMAPTSATRSRASASRVHGGMGYVEETGAAQYFRDARITPIYEGTNGIQAADLVGRKLGLENGAAFAALVADMRAEARHPELVALIYAVEAIAHRLATADADDRLAASYPFLTMTAVAVCGWLMEREGRHAGGDEAFATLKRAAVAFYLDQIVPEALGLKAAATASAEVLYAVPAEAFAA
ncbi:MAG: acyl-CoA dehydrogenase C-terminal domain-containing protein [Sphingomonas taxi]